MSEERPRPLSEEQIQGLMEAGEKKGKTLSKTEVQELLVDTGAKAVSRKSSRPVMLYDFKHPSRVSKEQIRTLENLHSNFARMMASSFSTTQRSVVDVDIAFVDQTTYAEFIMSLSNPSCSYQFTVEPLGGPAILDFSLPVCNSFIDRQFGGTGEKALSGRPLTRIERTVMGEIVSLCLSDLEAIWEPLLKIRVSDAELETNPEFMQVAAPADTVVLIAFEVNGQHFSGLMNLCYPYFTLEPVMAYLNVKTWASRDRRRDNGLRQKRLNQFRSVDLNLTTVWGRGRLLPQDVAGLRVGDTLILNTRADDPAVIYVEDLPIFLARPGISEKGSYAAEVLHAIPQDEARHYT